MEQIAMHEPMIQKAIAAEKLFRQDEQEWNAYLLIERGRMERECVIDSARNEGREEGREEGIEQNKIATARTMLKKDMPLELIAEISGLSIAKIKKLEK